MVTAVLPLYLGSIGLGAAALGVMEGAADFLFSLAKLAGGYARHSVPIQTVILIAAGCGALGGGYWSRKLKK